MTAIYALQPFIPADEITKVNNYIKSSGVLKPRVNVDTLFQSVTEEVKREIAAGKTDNVPEHKEPTEATPVVISDVIDEKTDTEILGRTKLGKAEQYVFIMSKVRH